MESISMMRKTLKLPTVPLLTLKEAQQRIRVPPVPSTPKATVIAPEGQGGDLWWALYNDARRRGFSDPEKMADSALRAREKAKLLEASRPTVKVEIINARPNETAANEKAARKAKAIPHDAVRCKAMTLAGRRCGFKSTCGEFCKKHSIVV